MIIILVLCLSHNRISLMRKGYNWHEQGIILNLDKDKRNDVLDYDGYIDVMNWNEYSNQSNYVLYDLIYQNSVMSKTKIVNYVDSYMELKPQLDELGFSQDVIIKRIDELSIDDLKSIISQNVSYNKVKKYMNITGYQVCDFKDYLKYDGTALEAVLHVSYPGINTCDLNDRTYLIEQPDNLLVLSKKGFMIDESYEPGVREVDIASEEGAYLIDEAASSLEKMNEDASKLGLSLVVKSSYRSYENQKELYDYYLSIYDYSYASTLVNVPGFSEYQLGLAIDLTSQSVLGGIYTDFSQTEEYQWLVNNSYKYGFILRYPENESDRTGAMNEPWHFRYVGKDIAKEIYEKNELFEDYIWEHGFSYSLKLQ
ncbi:MAG: M15 family metallopeptidase [Erysipelotrichaceae bacterium]|nr:M15 family metallopeptidase [Erysipelotrichaceae bacterium]